MFHFGGLVRWLSKHLLYGVPYASFGWQGFIVLLMIQTFFTYESSVVVPVLSYCISYSYFIKRPSVTLPKFIHNLLLFILNLKLLSYSFD